MKNSVHGLFAVLATVLAFLGCASQSGQEVKSAGKAGDSCHHYLTDRADIDNCLGKIAEERTPSHEEALSEEAIGLLPLPGAGSPVPTSEMFTVLQPPPSRPAVSGPTPIRAALSASQCIGPLITDPVTGKKVDSYDWKGTDGGGCVPQRNFKIKNDRPGTGLVVILDGQNFCQCGTGWWSPPLHVKYQKKDGTVAILLREDVILYGQTARYFVPPGANGIMGITIQVFDLSGQQGSEWHPAPYLGKVQDHLNIPEPQGLVSQGITVFPSTKVDEK